jgi:hypothetical protein
MLLCSTCYLTWVQLMAGGKQVRGCSTQTPNYAMYCLFAVTMVTAYKPDHNSVYHTGQRL